MALRSGWADFMRFCGTLILTFSNCQEKPVIYDKWIANDDTEAYVCIRFVAFKGDFVPVYSQALYRILVGYYGIEEDLGWAHTQAPPSQLLCQFCGLYIRKL